ncbi:MAG: hypothetical protein HKN07_01870 [Acidimicrobiia bacterium]|nr:hypothetical protein [Acidimicrobiia bacterium]
MTTFPSSATRDQPTAIALDVPAEPSAARVVRAVASSVASGVSMGYDRIEDLALAIGEAYSFLLATGPSAIRATLGSTPDGIHIAMEAVEASSESPEPWATSLNRVVLESVAENVEQRSGHLSFAVGATAPVD